MKVGQKVYTYNKTYTPQAGSIMGKAKIEVRTGVIVSRGLRWNPYPYYEYVVRDVKDLQTVGIAGALVAAFNGTPESLSVHTRSTLYKFKPQPVSEETEEIES